MKRYGGLWDRLVCWDNLIAAARKSRRGKRGRNDVQRFDFNEEQELLALHAELSSGSYCPAGFSSHWVTRAKPRLISVAPYRDRVVHHAVMNVLEPILDRHFHPDSYACRRGKGVHAAADRLQQWMGRRRFVLQCDIVGFFPNIDHEILKGKFRRLVKDRAVLALLDRIVDTSNAQGGAPAWFPGDDLLTPIERGRGLPIGNLTSQWFANWFLNDLDHFITSGLGLGAYVRYCDDFVVLDNERERLREAQAGVAEYLSTMRLNVHRDRAFVRPVRGGLRFVGYRMWSTHRLLRKSNIRAFRRRVKWMRDAYAAGRMEWQDVKTRLASWIGHARQADSTRLLRRLSREWVFTRARTERVSGDSGRRVEQQCHELPDHQPEHQHADESEQQHWVPCRPALSVETEGRARNRAVYGRRERGCESPGSRPVPAEVGEFSTGRICATESRGVSRVNSESPSRFQWTPGRGKFDRFALL